MPFSLPAFCGTPLSAQELDLICDCVAKFRCLSRAELAATVCEWLGWERPNGRLKTRECRDLLQELEALDWLNLPAPQPPCPGSRMATPERR